MNGDYQEAYEPGNYCGYSCPVIFQSCALYGFRTELQGLFSSFYGPLPVLRAHPGGWTAG